MKILLISIFIILSLNLYSEDNFQFPSTRPGYATGVYPIGLYNSALESGIVFDKNNLIQNFAYTYNFIKHLEVRFENDYQYNIKTSTNIISFKYLIIENKKYIPDIGLLYNYSGKGNIILLLQKEFNKVVIVCNFEINNKSNIYALSINYNINKKFGYYEEIYGLISKEISIDDGFFYSINKDLQIDLSLYFNNLKTYSISTGIAYRFK